MSADNQLAGMFLRAKTGSATLLQFIANTVLSLLGTLVAVIAGCLGASATECLSNTLVSLILVLLMIAAYGVLLAIGYVAQERRDRRLAVALIGLEALAAAIFLFDAAHSPMLFDRMLNAAQFITACWVIFIAIRQFRARSGRMVRLPRH